MQESDGAFLFTIKHPSSWSRASPQVPRENRSGPCPPVKQYRKDGGPEQPVSNPHCG